jgi:putative endonuclease
MASKSRVLSVGITNAIVRRVWEHRNSVHPGFTSKCRIHRLVYFEMFKYVGNAITREKRIKGWLREKKGALIRSANPTWEDLSEGWFEVICFKAERNASEKQVFRSAQDDQR